MMPLHTRLKRSELKDAGRFDFLTGLTGYVKRVDEFHASPENDSHFVYMIWLKDEDLVGPFVAGLRRNINLLSDGDWDYEVYDLGHGLVTVRTEL